VACANAREAIAKRFDLALAPIERSFIYMPLMHAEALEEQNESVRLFRALADSDCDRNDNLRYAEHHREVIRRFGRFPHRNAILGHLSTAAEEEFLAAKATVHSVFADAAPFLPLGRFHKSSPVFALRDVFSKGELIKTDWSGEDHNGERHLD